MTERIQTLDEAARLLSVEKDVAGLKEGLVALGTTVDKGFRDLTTDLKARASINWAPVNIMLGVCTVAGGLFFTWVNSNTGRLETSIAKVEATSQRYVPREDLDVRFAVSAQRRDDLQRLTDARVERIERDVDAVSKRVVDRSEHDTVRQLQQRDYDLLRNRIERVEARFEKRTDGLGRGLEKLEDRTVPRVELQGQFDARDRALGTLRSEVDEHNRAFTDRQQRRIDALEAAPRK